MPAIKEANRGLRRHQLLTAPDRKELIKQALSTKDLREKRVIAKFFCPYSYWTWYAVEFDGQDTFYGLVYGHEREWGSFSYGELQETQMPVFGTMLPMVERDTAFQPITVRKLEELLDLGTHV